MGASPRAIKGSPLDKPGVGQNIALHAAPVDRASNYLVSAYPIHSTSSPPKRFTRGGVLRTHKLCPPPHTVGTQGYQRFPLYKFGVGHNIASHAVPADRTSTYLVSAFRIYLTFFLSILNTEMCYKQ